MNRRTVLVAFGAAVLLLVVWFFLLWGPQGGELSDAQERRDAAAGQNTALQVRLDRLRGAQDRAPDLEADRDELRAAVPDDPDLAQFILDANDIATAAGVEFLSINPGAPSASTDGGPPVITLGINVTGGYFEVLDYLARLEALPRIVVIDSLTLTPNEAEGVQEITVTITARMFSQNLPSTAPQAVAAGDAATTGTTVAPSSTSPTTSGGADG